MEFLRDLFQRQMARRILALGIFCLLLFLLREVINLFLFTFLFTYLMYSAQNSIHGLMQKIFPVKIKKYLVTAVLYLTILCLIVLAIYKYIPVAIAQFSSIITQVVEMVTKFSQKTYDSTILNFIATQLQQVDIGSYVGGKSGYLLKLAGSVGGLGLNIFLSLILSLFFILEKDRVVRFMEGFKESRIAWLFQEMEYFGSRLLNSFGKVIQAQFLIAVCNSVLSVIALWIMGFPQLLGLAVMIFLLSLIPVAGVVISLVPLSVIAFRIGGINEVLYVVLMILAIHAFESYFLNPKLMSAKTNLPIFFTFLLLIISEHIMGIWGLIIGIPIFIFLLDLIDFKVLGKKE